MRRALRWAAVLAVVIACVGALAGRELLERWHTPLVVPAEGAVITVAPGDTLRTVAAGLHQQGILAHPRLLIAYGRVTGLDSRLRRGEYRLIPGTTPEALLALLVSGKVLQYQVTLPEGITVAQALVLLEKEAALETVLVGRDDERLLQLVAPYQALEGLFLPETYRFERGDTDLDILRRAHLALRDVLAREWQQRPLGLPYSEPYEALIMASIIERETGVPDEREQIAGVFVRRLQQGMRLQTDPTIIYGLGAEFDGNLARSHLRDAGNLFNTYRHHGLPPTPIALPGLAAIRAALNPAPGDTLFFVARGDGSHEFNATLEGHQQAVRKYQLKRRQDYRSTPGKL
ncbi:endolytic transglycosylase MltG [Kineobactrum sediminis]|uniref:Endolytic murein transglycosylase n=1 Tax=Kineobactrum sediminis TaxID=1905677 RepID=A0A2N5Y171_9GAMM|nr:endolytic transglycosylase MltG [Kineobactrum sediminis]PLW82135.1 endolytic transglycosylase MltG [Kineobactrum sediminis]